MTFKINDVVVLRVDIPEEALRKGSKGVVVEEFSEPTKAYEIEFCNDLGETLAQVALLPSQIELALADEKQS